MNKMIIKNNKLINENISPIELNTDVTFAVKNNKITNDSDIEGIYIDGDFY